VYGASEGLATVALEGVAPGGQAGTSPRIDNYLGFPAGISGAELAERAEIQAGKFGAQINVPAESVALHADDGHWLAEVEGGAQMSARVVVIATGARYRRLSAERIEEFEGTSVYYAATQVEAHICHGDPVAVVGGGNSAGQAALFLTRYASELRLIVRNDELDRDMSRYLADEIRRTPNLRVMLSTEVEALVGERSLEALVVEDLETHERATVPARALFVFIGVEPHTDWLEGQLDLDKDGFIVTGGPDKLPLQTSSAGVFAAGDVRSGSTKRLSAAVGEGAMAVRLIHQYLAQT
jgi:thioredoxin reductase (NADPH)